MHEDEAALLERIRAQFTVHFEPLAIDDISLQVLAIDNMQEHIDKLLARHSVKNPLRDLPLWAKVWPGSLVLGRLLRKYEPNGKTMLELGCGMGLVSLIAAHYGFSHIDCTDVNEQALLFARANILHNGLDDRITVSQLDLQVPTPNHADRPIYDIIAASELLYLPELHTPILKFAAAHLAPSGLALFCTDRARRQKDFPKKAAKYFNCQEGNIGIKTKDGDTVERHVYGITILKRNAS
ncbi:MAG: methyltransferase [Desulfovibrionaceae bacterium]|nr:methyltransferase [Desulfovibrionaceae bacterium]